MASDAPEAPAPGRAGAHECGTGGRARAPRALVTAAALLLALCAHATSGGEAWARGGGGCVAWGTPVETPGGPVPIERLREGDLVLTPDGAAVAVLGVFDVVSDEAYLVPAAAAGAPPLLATAEHPVRTAPGRYERAAALGARVPGPVRARNLVLPPPGAFVAAGRAVHNKGCFVPETPVLLEDGREVPISTVRPGDRVRAFDGEGRAVVASVLRVFTLDADLVLDVATEGGRVVRATAEHPFAVPGGAFRTVESLAPGDAILVWGARGPALDRVRSVRRAPGPARVWNLATDAPHTFVAGGFAVHNKGGGGGCFVVGTPVRVPGGARPIESLAPGDTVLSGDGVPVRVILVAVTADDVLLVETSQGVLGTTAEHPLLLARGRFEEAGALGPRDFLRAFEGREPVRARSVRASGERALVYEIAVDPPHTYVAGGIVVHNKGGGFGGGRSSFGRGSSGGRSRPMTPAERRIFLIVVVGAGAVLVVAKLAEGRRGGGDRSQQDLDFCFTPAQVRAKADKTRVILEKIAANDEDMRPDALDRIVREAFLTLQQCWEARDYARMAPLVFPDLRAQHEAQIASMKRSHEVNRIKGVMIREAPIVHLRYTERREGRQVTALIHASAIDYYEDDRTGRFLRGDRTSASFQELWTFQLHGERWLLREIEQSRESTALRDENFVEFLTKDKLASAYGPDLAARRGAAGPWTERAQLAKETKIHRMLNFLVETDRVWDEGAMQDRARAAAVAHHAAIEALSTAPLEGLATAELRRELDADFAAKRGQGYGIQFRNLCVRKVELVLVRNRADDGRDEFFARVSLHAQRIRTRQGVEVSKDADVAPAEGLYRFQRVGEAFLLAEVMRPSEASGLLAAENVDEDSTPDRLQWYYTQPRTVGGTSG